MKAKEPLSDLSGLAARETAKDVAYYTPNLKGDCFVRPNFTCGSDLTVVNAARISMDKRSYNLGEKDEKLIRFLIKNKHTSPLRHEVLSFHIRAPIFVLRQWMKHQVGCSWNEMSLRYVKHDGASWMPLEWREAAPSVKQGSGGPLSEEVQDTAWDVYNETLNQIQESYDKLLELGVCKEQARFLLPMATLTECWWTASLQAVLHFLTLRSDDTAQEEIRWFADRVRNIVKTHYPITYKYWVEFNA